MAENYSNIKIYRRSNSDLYLTETDQVIVRNLLGDGHYEGAATYLRKESACPPYCEDHIIRELQYFYNGSISNELEPEMDTFYPPVGGQV